MKYLTLILLLCSFSIFADENKMFVGAVSHHTSKNLETFSDNSFKYNEKHALLGYEYNNKYSYGFSVFQDSFKKTSFILSTGKHIKVNKYFSYGGQLFFSRKGDLEVLRTTYPYGIKIYKKYKYRNIIAVMPYIEIGNKIFVRLSVIPSKEKIDSTSKIYGVYSASFGFKF